MSKGIDIKKQDIIWGYISLFFSIASGVIILPMILIKLSTEEVGMNYIMLSIGQLVSLVDFGFSPQFGRNITYIYSGAQRLLKNGIEVIDSSKDLSVNYHLLENLIQTARWIYRVMSGIVLFIMMTVGTTYIYHLTNGFSNLSGSFIIWILFSLSIFFQIYYSYYNSLLTGSGKIKESKKVVVYSNILKIVLTYFLLSIGCGLLGVVIANLVYPFFTRFLSYKYYFTDELKIHLSIYKIVREERYSLFKILWYNSKKMGVITFSGYLTYGASTLLAGIYLSLDEVASYGLMIQLVTLVSGISGILISIYQPRFASLNVLGDINMLRKETAYTMCVFYLLFLIGTIFIIFLGPFAVHAIGSQTLLPSAMMILVCALFRLLDHNFWNLCKVVIAGNDFPFLNSCLCTGVGITIGCYLSLSWFHWGLWGIVLSTGLVQSLWNNWYWPHRILKQLNTNELSFLKEGYNEIRIRFLSII